MTTRNLAFFSPRAGLRAWEHRPRSVGHPDRDLFGHTTYATIFPSLFLFVFFLTCYAFISQKHKWLLLGISITLHFPWVPFDPRSAGSAGAQAGPGPSRGPALLLLARPRRYFSELGPGRCVGPDTSPCFFSFNSHFAEWMIIFPFRNDIWVRQKIYIYTEVPKRAWGLMPHKPGRPKNRD